MSNQYGKMLDEAYGTYYERFRTLGAISKETAVTIEELFPEGETLVDRDRMHKMLSSEIVKRQGVNKYWLNEKMASDPGKVLKQRLLVLVGGILFAVVLLVIESMK